MTTREQAVTQLYQDLRIDDQRRWYAGRARLYATAHKQSRYGRVALLGMASGAGGASAIANGTWSAALGVAAATLAALATGLVAYDAMMGFEPLQKLYHDAARNLALATTPEQAEKVIKNEASHWGQLTLNASHVAHSSDSDDQSHK